jgi:hypothetical protein
LRFMKDSTNLFNVLREVKPKIVFNTDNVKHDRQEGVRRWRDLALASLQ